MSVRRWFLALALAVPLVGAQAAWAQTKKERPKDPTPQFPAVPIEGNRTDAKPEDKALSFGTLRATSAEEARSQALAWLKGVGKSDATTLASFDAIWKQDERSVLDRVADSLVLGDADARRLLEDARDSSRPAPMDSPDILKDSKRPTFYRSNLGLAYGKALSNRRVYEESLGTLRSVTVEQVVDPSAYLFHRAVAEHALGLKNEANRSIIRLLDDAVDAPDRYKLVAVLMAFDMQSWSEADIKARLGGVARKMDNVERRLELARGGPHTQKIQKEVVRRLDEIIKELENQAKGD